MKSVSFRFVKITLAKIVRILRGHSEIYQCVHWERFSIRLVNPWPSWLISTNPSEFSSWCFAVLIWFRLSKNSCSCWAFKSSFFDSILSWSRFIILFQTFPRSTRIDSSWEPWQNDKSFLEPKNGKNDSYSTYYGNHNIWILSIWGLLMLFDFFLCLWHLEIL